MAAQLEEVKWIPGTRFLVDGFRFQHPDCSAYFLTHAHSDHTTGLSRGWSAGTIYTSPVTARLITEELGLRAEFVRAVPLDTPTIVDGVRVVFLDANHCPGSCMLLFAVPQGGGAVRNVLHTGDFRFQPFMAEFPALAAVRVHTLVLDTTYASPRWTFPYQDRVIDDMVAIMKETRLQSPECAFAVNSYHIGKERCYFGAALKAGMRVWASNRKLQTLLRLDLPPSWMASLVDAAADADIIIADSGVNPNTLATLSEGLRRPFVGFQCTGWSYQKSGIRKRDMGGFLVYGIPYSEHSSWNELQQCVSMLKPQKLIPTVNVRDAASLCAMCDKFAKNMDLSRSRGHIDMYLVKRKRARCDEESRSVEESAEPRVDSTQTAVVDLTQSGPGQDQEGASDDLGVDKVAQRVWGEPLLPGKAVHAGSLELSSHASAETAATHHDGGPRLYYDICDQFDLESSDGEDERSDPQEVDPPLQSMRSMYEACGWRRC